MAAYRAPKGTKDVLPEQSYQWQFLEARIREIVKKYGFQEVRTPVFEHTELFLRGVGEQAYIVKNLGRTGVGETMLLVERQTAASGASSRLAPQAVTTGP